MIYSNIKVSPQVEATPSGIEYYIALGEQGRGRKQIKLHCLKDTVIRRGMNPGLTIALVKGRTFILPKQDKNLYILFTSQGGYTSRSDGTIWVQACDKEKIYLLTRGNGGDGTDFKVGNWDCLLLKVRNPAESLLFQIQPAGMEQKYPQTVYMVENGMVYAYNTNTLRRVSGLLQVDSKAEIYSVQEGPLSFGKEWYKL